jgi:hypothetical protein
VSSVSIICCTIEGWRYMMQVRWGLVALILCKIPTESSQFCPGPWYHSAESALWVGCISHMDKWVV